jgi:hypothetical protein
MKHFGNAAAVVTGEQHDDRKSRRAQIVVRVDEIDAQRRKPRFEIAARDGIPEFGRFEQHGSFARSR